MIRSPEYSRGLTLIELMISMVIGLLLLAGITGMFMTNKRIYKEQESMSRLQENSRFAIDLLIKEIRMAGYTGCADDIKEVKNHVVGQTGATDLLDFSNAVEGAEQGKTANWLPSGSNSQIGNMVSGTDGISVRYLATSDLQIIAPFMNTNAAALHVNDVTGFKQGQIIGVADCGSADIFSISNIPSGPTGFAHNTGQNNSGPENGTQDLQKKYLDDASIVKFVARRYIIQQGASGQPALFRYQFALDPSGKFVEMGEELIDGVEDMQILYGEDTTGNLIADTYLEAANVGSWENVVSVRISLLFNNLDENNQIEKDVKVHKLLGGAAAGGSDRGPYNDTRRRRVFTTTVQIRNRSA